MTWATQTIVSWSSISHLVEITADQEDQLFTVVIIPEYDEEQNDINKNKQALKKELKTSKESWLSDFSL